jgi:hypothetical protein
VTGLADDTWYEFQVRAYVEGQNPRHYGPWSSIYHSRTQ